MKAEENKSKEVLFCLVYIRKGKASSLFDCVMVTICQIMKIIGMISSIPKDTYCVGAHFPNELLTEGLGQLATRSCLW